ncbi:hypothetical protein Ancab_003226 [Ancistrocladus abbreviatus]
MLDNKKIFQERVMSGRKAEYDRLRQEREERISQILQARRQERELKTKMIFYLRSEEERLKKLQHEEEAQKREEAEQRRKEEAERKAKLDEIAEKQRQRERELEEKERLRREQLLGRSAEPVTRPSEPLGVPQADQGMTAPVAATAAALPAPAKYVPRFKRQTEGSAVHAPPPEPNRWGSGRRDDRLSSDRWRSEDSRPFGSGSRDERRVSGGGGPGGSSRPTWSSSRAPARTGS